MRNKVTQQLGSHTRVSHSPDLPSPATSLWILPTRATPGLHTIHTQTHAYLHTHTHMHPSVGPPLHTSLGHVPFVVHSLPHALSELLSCSGDPQLQAAPEPPGDMQRAPGPADPALNAMGLGWATSQCLPICR